MALYQSLGAPANVAEDLHVCLEQNTALHAARKEILLSFQLQDGVH
jgi:hypothetical protein